jgi:hypothetical protein
MQKKETLKLAILAKSNKSRHDGSYGSCIAGVTPLGEWIRLVSTVVNLGAAFGHWDKTFYREGTCGQGACRV